MSSNIRQSKKGLCIVALHVFLQIKQQNISYFFALIVSLGYDITEM